MTFGGLPPSPPQFDPRDTKALLRAAEQDRQHNLGLTQDVAIVLGWLRRAIIWPAGVVLRIVRRNNHDEVPDEG